MYAHRSSYKVETRLDEKWFTYKAPKSRQGVYRKTSVEVMDEERKDMKEVFCPGFIYELISFSRLESTL